MNIIIQTLKICLISFQIIHAINESDQGVDMTAMLATGPRLRKYLMAVCVRQLLILSDTPSFGIASRPFG